MRLLAAAEVGAAGLSLGRPQNLPVHIQQRHWDWACQHYMCGLGSGQGCPPKAPWDLRLWHITVFPGYAHKLEMLGYPTPQHLAADFGSAYNALSAYLRRHPPGDIVVDSGALRLHARTWLKRFEILKIPVSLEGLEDQSAADLG